GSVKDEHGVKISTWRLRLSMDSDEHVATYIAGMLAQAKVPMGKNSRIFTQLLHFAFHQAKCQPEPSQLSRWAWALEHAWNQNPRPTPEDVTGFIQREGGDVVCREKARKAVNAANDGNANRTAPTPYQLSCPVPDAFVGQWVKVDKDDAGRVQLIPK